MTINDLLSAYRTIYVNLDRLQIANQTLLSPTDLDVDRLANLLGEVGGSGVDYADLYFQHSEHEGWALENGIVREASYNLEHGVGARVVSGDKSGFAYSDDLSLASLRESLGAARAIVRHGGSGKRPALNARQHGALYHGHNPIPAWESARKVTFLQQLDRLARSLDPAVSEVTVSLSAVHDTVLVAATDGTLAADVRPLVRLNVSVIAERNGRRERGSAGGGGDS